MGGVVCRPGVMDAGGCGWWWVWMPVGVGNFGCGFQ